MTSFNSNYGFVIDTNEYAGNFEREMCAYITGRVGECEVGGEDANVFNQEEREGLFENVLDLPDDHGCRRPCSIFADSDDEDHNSVIIFFDKIPTDKELKIMKRRSIVTIVKTKNIKIKAVIYDSLYLNLAYLITRTN